MREGAIVRRTMLFAGVLVLALIAGGITLRQGDTFPALAATGATPTPCLIDRDVPYYGGADLAITRPTPPPAAPPPAPSPAIPAMPGDRHIPPRPPLQHPCQLQLLDQPGTP